MPKKEREDEYKLMKFKETELCLGLPSGNDGGDKINNSVKRGYLETIDLKLNLASNESSSSKIDPHQKIKININSPSTTTTTTTTPKEKNLLDHSSSKVEVVGWPPVRSYRKTILSEKKKSSDDKEEEEKVKNSGVFVKVSMEGAPYLRKVDLKMYKSYQDLSDSLAKMFSSFTIGKCGPNGMKDFMNESKLMDLLSGSEYLPTYEDKDGDWMLVGDVPWQMFVDSCKRIRIMKGADAIGLAAPRASEKCRSRS